MPRFDFPPRFAINDNLIADPAPESEAAFLSTVKGPNIKECPSGRPLPASLACACTLKVGDNITTDHIMPAGAKILPFRSNIPKLSEFCFAVCDEDFPKRSKEAGEGIIVGGENYGQGSSREHAALVPLYLGVRAVIAKSFARIHADNLVNAGILPLVFENSDDADRISVGDMLKLPSVGMEIAEGRPVTLELPDGDRIMLRTKLSERQKKILMAGGLLRYTVQSPG